MYGYVMILPGGRFTAERVAGGQGHEDKTGSLNFKPKTDGIFFF